MTPEGEMPSNVPGNVPEPEQSKPQIPDIQRSETAQVPENMPTKPEESQTEENKPENTPQRSDFEIEEARSNKESGNELTEADRKLLVDKINKLAVELENKIDLLPGEKLEWKVMLVAEMSKENKEKELENFKMNQDNNKMVSRILLAGAGTFLTKEEVKEGWEFQDNPYKTKKEINDWLEMAIPKYLTWQKRAYKQSYAIIDLDRIKIDRRAQFFVHAKDNTIMEKQLGKGDWDKMVPIILKYLNGAE